MFKIINYKHLTLYLMILCATLFMVFYRYIDYAYKTPSRLQNITASDDYDIPHEEVERLRKNTFIQNFLALKANFSVDLTHSDSVGAKFRVIPIIILSVFFYT